MRELKKEELAQVVGAGRKQSYNSDDCYAPRKQKGNNGFGNGGHDGVPGNSGKQDFNR